MRCCSQKLTAEEAAELSINSNAAHSSAWNKAGTFEEKDYTTWAKDRLKARIVFASDSRSVAVWTARNLCAGLSLLTWHHRYQELLVGTEAPIRQGGSIRVTEMASVSGDATVHLKMADFFTDAHSLPSRTVAQLCAKTPAPRGSICETGIATASNIARPTHAPKKRHL